MGAQDDAFERATSDEVAAAESPAADPWEQAAAAAGVGTENALAEAKAMAKLLNPLLDDDTDDDGAAQQLLDDSLTALQDTLSAAEAGQAAAQVYQELLARVGEANPRPRIEPVRRFAELAGVPQASYPIIQVAGTNGKTSTSRIIAALLQEQGLNVGLFTSPHLVNFTERIQLNGEAINGVDLALTWQSLKPALQVVDAELAAKEQGAITFFEALAVLAFAAFADAPVEVAVIEVGMGGQWDATNIAIADVAVFTPIALDHVGMLGETVAEIAATKAQIIKPGSVAVTSAQQAAALTELQRYAKQLDVPLSCAGIDFSVDSTQAVGGRLLSVKSEITGTVYSDLLLSLFGAHQAENAALALAATELFLGRALDYEVVEAAFATVTSPGRLQLVSNKPPVLVDAAHNPHGVAALSAALKENFIFSDGLCVVAGALADKDAVGVLSGLCELATKIILVPVSSERSLTVQQLEEFAQQFSAKGIETTVAENTATGVTAARNWATASADRGVLVAGSVLLAGSAIAQAADEGW